MPAAWVAAGGALLGGLSSAFGSKNQTVTNKSEMDPRTAGMLFGNGGADQGLLAKYRGMLDTQQSPELAQYGQANLNYLGNAPGDMGMIRDTARGLLTGGPQAGVKAWAVGNQVAAPGQNNLDLTSSYNSLIGGEAGNNPYLTGAIAKGINQSSNAFGNMISDATKATNDVIGGIRGNSVLAGQYGGSRQGVAEGNAINSMNTQLGRAASQFGQNNTDAAVAAQAAAYDADRNRQLAATQGLGAQQYGVAGQNAATKNAAEFMNVGNVQQSDLANLAARQTSVGQGSSLLGGLLGTAANAGQNQDAYALNQAAKVNGLLAPYLGQVPGSSTSNSPLYQNTAGNMLGGATAGLGLYNMYNQGNSGYGAGGGRANDYSANMQQYGI
jgi:hypothetical protein